MDSYLQSIVNVSCTKDLLMWCTFCTYLYNKIYVIFERQHQNGIRSRYAFYKIFAYPCWGLTTYLQLNSINICESITGFSTFLLDVCYTRFMKVTKNIFLFNNVQLRLYRLHNFSTKLTVNFQFNLPSGKKKTALHKFHTLIEKFHEITLYKVLNIV